MSLHSPGKAFRAALTKENPLQIVGTINANHALLAQRAGYQAIYLSGGGVAATVRNWSINSLRRSRYFYS